jgi:ferredoxin-NADP reductase
MLERLVPDFKEREIFLCGPVSMNKSMREIFAASGVAGKYVHFERFALG